MTSTPIQSVSSDKTVAEPSSPLDIDASCRGPVLLLLGSSLLWLLFGSILALIVAIKLHKGDFLANCPWMTYGRLRPAQMNIFLYGFASQAALGVGLWILARLGKTLLAAPFLAIVGTKFWNLGVAIGVFGILAGDSSGFEWFEMPRYASPILFFSYLAIGLAAGLTFASRRERTLYVSQWFLVAAFLAFPWIYSTANLLLHFHPVRGATQAMVNYWFANGFLLLWLTPVALAAIFYFIPKVIGRLLYSQYLAAIGFWSFVLLAGWCGVPPGARLPSWMSSLSTVATVLLLVPVFAFALSWKKTLSGHCAEAKASLPFKFIGFATIAFVLAAVLAAMNSLHGFSRAVEFTFFPAAIAQLFLYGFFGMTIFASIYYIVPQLTRAEWCPKGLKIHFICSALGILLVVVGLAVGGIIQGSYQNSPDAEFMKSVKSSIPFIGLSTLGALLLILGNFTFLGNFGSVMRKGCGACCSSKTVAEGRRS